MLSGGVAANEYVRERMEEIAMAQHMQLVCSEPRLCTDNGVMIAWTGFERYILSIGVFHTQACTEILAPISILVGNFDMYCIREIVICNSSYHDKAVVLSVRLAHFPHWTLAHCKTLCGAIGFDVS